MYKGNPYFSSEKAEYLKLNDLEEAKSNISATMHYKNIRAGLLVSVMNDHVDVFDVKGALPKLVHAFTGISKLDITGWIMLMQITGAVTIKMFAANVKKANQPYAEGIMEEVMQVMSPAFIQA